MKPEIRKAAHFTDEMVTLVVLVGGEIDGVLLSENIGHPLDHLVGEVTSEKEWVNGCLAQLHKRVILLGLGLRDLSAFNTDACSLAGLVDVAVVDLLLC